MLGTRMFRCSRSSHRSSSVVLRTIASELGISESCRPNWDLLPTITHPGDFPARSEARVTSYGHPRMYRRRQQQVKD